MADLSYIHVLFRGRYWLPSRPQQEADDLLSERTSATTRKAGLLLGHVSVVKHFLVPQLCSVLLCAFHTTSDCPSNGPRLGFLCPSGRVSSQPPALCHTSSVSLTLGPSLSVTHLLSSSAPSTTLLHCNPVKRSSCPGEHIISINMNRPCKITLLGSPRNTDFTLNFKYGNLIF